MTAKLLDGKKCASEISKQLSTYISTYFINTRKPSLSVILVGQQQDSIRYVHAKQKSCQEIGIESSHSKHFPDTISEQELMNEIDILNNKQDIDGILIQLPLPTHINQERILQRIHYQKDVDGFHPYNVGLLTRYGEVMRRQQQRQQQQNNNSNTIQLSRVPCTPLGIVELLQRNSIPISGKRISILGRSNLVGLPTALLMMHLNGTISTIHSRTPVEIAKSITRESDIVICAIGKPSYVDSTWIKPGSTVIDVGIHVINGKLQGDVNFPSVANVAGYVTPVPGGVGPMTVAMLMRNTVFNAAERLGISFLPNT
jgi:methylenetetrahydrofolate dehydrogenase (NADP+)/methenyltetrahydrofolate cyclohydrolase